MYNNNDWGPEIIIEKCGDGECQCEEPCYKQILDNIHSRIVKALNSGDNNAEIIHKK